MAVKRGYTVIFDNQPSVISYAAYVGKKEKEGPLRDYFEFYDDDTTFGKTSWEKSESQLQMRAFAAAEQRAGQLLPQAIVGGDLLNQCVASHYASRGANIPFIGVYGACSTMAESLAVASVMIDGGSFDRVAAITSSHFCSAERQFRFPLEYGGQRTRSSQWTVTGSGCVILGADRSSDICVTQASFGRIRDFGIKDINNMGAAMAPAAADTILRYFADSNYTPDDFNLVVTGDLGNIGSDLLAELLAKDGMSLKNHFDCGKVIYDTNTQYVASGGSGCGCSASVLCAYLLPLLEAGQLKRILFIATGALMSPTTFQQKESIPSIAHAVVLENIAI